MKRLMREDTKEQIKDFFKLFPSSFLRFLNTLHILSDDFVYKNALAERARKEVMRFYDPDVFYLNIGGGALFSRKNWRIIDFSDSKYRYKASLLDYNVNLLELNTWDIPDQKADLVYTSHCLEHLTNEAVEQVFHETYRIMKPGSVFRVTLPYIDLAYNAYLQKDIDFFEVYYGKRDLESSLLSFFSPYSSVKNFDFKKFKKDANELDKISFLNKYIYKKIDFSTHNFGTHINWFDFNKIKQHAIKAGFKEENVTRSAYKQSLVAEFRGTEFDTSHPEFSLYVEIGKSI
jgi:ubiquinone/menaquinone biosynthesis C-methylase UbiE